MSIRDLILCCTSAHCGHLEIVNNTTCKQPIIGYSSFANVILHSDDGSHFKHNKTPHKMTCGLVFVQWRPLNTGKNNKERQTKDCYRVAAAAYKRWPLNTGNKCSVCTSEKSGL